MKALIVLGCIALALFLIGCIPVGADVAYDPEGLRLGVRIGPFTLRLGGKPEKEKKPRKEKKPKEAKKKEEKPAEKKPRKLPSAAIILSLLKNGCDLLCRFIAGLRVEFLRIHFVSAFEDPSVTALAYGMAGTAMDGLMRLGKGRIRFTDLRAEVDFDRGSPVIDFRVLVHITVGRVVGAALRFGAGFLCDLLREKRKEKKNGRASHRRNDERRDGEDPDDGGLEHRGGRAYRYA